MPYPDTAPAPADEEFTPASLSSDARGRADAVLRERGVVRLGRLGGRDDVLYAARRMMSGLWPHRDADPDGLTVIRDTGRHAGRVGLIGLGRGGLGLHTESAQQPRPPRLLLLACARAGDSGGESLLVDGRAVLAELAAFHPAALEALAAQRAAFFGGADGRFTPVLEQLPGGRWRLQLRQDSSPGSHAAAEVHLPALRLVIDRHASRLRLAAGQGILLDNHRFLHGRTAFRGERLLLRALGDPHPLTSLRAGFSAPWSMPDAEPSAPGEADM